MPLQRTNQDLIKPPLNKLAGCNLPKTKYCAIINIEHQPIVINVNIPAKANLSLPPSIKIKAATINNGAIITVKNQRTFSSLINTIFKTNP
uniref:hypothetical protein n=1 Tax=Psychrobacter sp. TaxID=56811 RepID=UPI0015EE92CA|nr:hypothetical protein [Psychrobacter sp.]